GVGSKARRPCSVVASASAANRSLQRTWRSGRATYFTQRRRQTCPSRNKGSSEPLHRVQRPRPLGIAQRLPVEPSSSSHFSSHRLCGRNGGRHRRRSCYHICCVVLSSTRFRP